MRTVKVVGVSGVGKSTLVTELKRIDCNLKSVNYGDFLQKTSGFSRNQLYLCRTEHYKLANRGFKKLLNKYKKKDCLVLVDEHLEIDNWQNLTEVYRRENTVGIVFLDVPPDEVLNRRRKDGERHRHQQALEEIQADQRIIKYKMEFLAKELDIPLLTIKTTSLKQSAKCVIYFIQKIMGR